MPVVLELIRIVASAGPRERIRVITLAVFLVDQILLKWSTMMYESREDHIV